MKRTHFRSSPVTAKGWLIAQLFFLLAIASGSPVRVILDTDIGPDTDDVGAVAVLHALASSGEAEIVGMLAARLANGVRPAFQP